MAEKVTASGPDDVVDGRLRRGARSRRIVLRAAVDMASADGLAGLSFGRLADATGVSKAGIQVLFRTKEALQLATIDHAAELFTDHVITPTASLDAGVDRLRDLVERWLDYATSSLFAGGCFWVATLAEQDSHPGPVRDALIRNRDSWVALIARQLRGALENGEVGTLDPDRTAFQIDAVLSATNVALRLGDEHAAERTRLVIEDLLS